MLSIISRAAGCLLCFSVLSSVSAADAPPDFGRVTEKQLMIPMRDGKHLSAYLYFPEGTGPWPVIFEQRYSDISGVGTRQAAAKMAASGYVVGMVNYRGTHRSEGEWVGYRALGWGELKDGYDTCEWLAQQPWSTGKIGTFGGSQAGFAQNFLAITRPPHLVAQYMTDTGLSLFQEGYRIGGITRPNRFKSLANVCRDPADNQKLLAAWFAHPNYDEYWRQEDCSGHFSEMNVPCFTVGSWYDFMSVGSIQSFIGRQHRGGPNSRGQQQLILGPWLHGGYPKSNRIGEMVYPENAFFDVYAHMTRWFDHYLKGINNGVQKDASVRYYVMGATGETNAPGNQWRTTKDWPVRVKNTAYFLGQAGHLSQQAPRADKSFTTYISDPDHPAEIPGTSFPGARDARGFERQTSVRTFTTEPLAKPIEWTGLVRAELFVSSTARDTDFIVRISDVYPDGRSILIMDYPRRARYRDGFEKEVLMEPGQIYKIAFDVGSLSQIFNRGHRIRVTVASTGAPLYEPNPQTGAALTVEWPAQVVAAENHIHHERRHASRILAPLK